MCREGKKTRRIEFELFNVYDLQITNKTYRIYIYSLDRRENNKKKKDLMMSNIKKLIHPTFSSRARTVLLVDYGSQSFISVPFSKIVDEREEPEVSDIYKWYMRKIMRQVIYLCRSNLLFLFLFLSLDFKQFFNVNSAC